MLFVSEIYKDFISYYISFTIIAWLKMIHSNNYIWLSIQNFINNDFVMESSISFELSTSQLINKYLLINYPLED